MVCARHTTTVQLPLELHCLTGLCKSETCILPSAEVLLGVTSRFRFALHRRSSCSWSWSQRWRSWTIRQGPRASSWTALHSAPPDCAPTTGAPAYTMVVYVCGVQLIQSLATGPVQQHAKQSAASCCGACQRNDDRATKPSGCCVACIQSRHEYILSPLKDSTPMSSS